VEVMVSLPCLTPLMLMSFSATFFGFCRFPFNNQDLQAVIVVQVHMGAGQDQVVVIMLLSPAAEGKGPLI
jgi:hypothetical protein